MDLSETQKIILAKAIGERNGWVTPELVQSIYSSKVNTKEKLIALEARGCIKKYINDVGFYRWRVRTRRKGKKELAIVPDDVLQMARNYKEMKDEDETDNFKYH